MIQLYEDISPFLADILNGRINYGQIVERARPLYDEIEEQKETARQKLLEKLESVMKLVVKFTWLSQDEIRSKCNRREIADAKKLFCYHAKNEYKSLSLSAIGNYIYDYPIRSSHHDKVIYCIKRMAEVPELVSMYEEFYETI